MQGDPPQSPEQPCLLATSCTCNGLAAACAFGRLASASPSEGASPDGAGALTHEAALVEHIPPPRDEPVAVVTLDAIPVGEFCETVEPPPLWLTVVVMEVDHE